jgi:hypothetical protein
VTIFIPLERVLDVITGSVGVLGVKFAECANSSTVDERHLAETDDL